MEEAIVYHEQRSDLVAHKFMGRLRKEIRRAEARKAESQKQRTLEVSVCGC